MSESVCSGGVPFAKTKERKCICKLLVNHKPSNMAQNMNIYSILNGMNHKIWNDLREPSEILTKVVKVEKAGLGSFSENVALKICITSFGHGLLDIWIGLDNWMEPVFIHNFNKFSFCEVVKISALQIFCKNVSSNFPTVQGGVDNKWL